MILIQLNYLVTDCHDSLITKLQETKIHPEVLMLENPSSFTRICYCYLYRLLTRSHYQDNATEGSHASQFGLSTAQIVLVDYFSLFVLLLHVLVFACQADCLGAIKLEGNLVKTHVK